jgi:hypothetical protein
MNIHKHDISVVLLIIVFFSHLVIGTIGSVSRKEYGESCSKTEKCKSQSWLTCDSSTETCLCAKPEEMVYSLKEVKCLAMIGERCKFGFDEDDHEAQRLWYEKVDCVPNAECGSSGLCHCLPGFYEDANATSCYPVKFRGMPCVNDFECNQDHLLTCINNSCQCDPKKSIYIADTPKPLPSGELGRCLGKVGSTCTSNVDDHCIPNAKCRSSGVCQCLPSFYEDANSTSCYPVKFRGMPCVNDFECHQDHLLACVNSTCQCDPKKSIFSLAATNPFSGLHGWCQGKVGSTCTSSDYCIPDAECKYDRTRGNICKCKYPLEPISNGQCGVPYGQSCLNHLNQRKNCIDSLVCLSFAQSGGYARSSCSCPDESYQRFDSTTHTCRSIVGSPCNPKLETSCTPMAKCIENQNSGIFLCECDDGHVETSRGTCQKAYGQTCSYGQGNQIPNHERCDEKAGLVCFEGSCSCKDTSNVYENGRRQCSRPVGVTCTEASQCVANAFCDKLQGEGLSGRCECLKDYHHVSRNRECVSDIDLTEDFVEGNSTTTKVP